MTRVINQAVSLLIRQPKLRAFLWRLGRRLYCEARYDVGNDPNDNGEYWLLEQLLASEASKSVVLFDIGANKGDWTAHALSVTEDSKKQPVTIYAFEPTSSTYAYLTKRFANQQSAVQFHQLAMSETTGEVTLYVTADLGGTNSLHAQSGNCKTERVSTLPFDKFVNNHGIDQIHMVKCDTEGHDLSVLRGAERTLAAGRVCLWQFEYNHRWVANHAFLKDVFDFIAGKPYRLAKLHGNRLEIFEAWHPELERFFEGNYVLIRNDKVSEALGTQVTFDESNVISPAFA